jgi:hypothetical protein
LPAAGKPPRSFLNHGPTCHPPSYSEGTLGLGGDDVRTPFAAAAAIAAYLSIYLSGGPPPNPGPGAPAAKLASLPVPPPMELVLPARLAAALRLLQYRPGGPAPMLEAAEGAPCRCGSCKRGRGLCVAGPRATREAGMDSSFGPSPCLCLCPVEVSLHAQATTTAAAALLALACAWPPTAVDWQCSRSFKRH